MPTIDLPQGTLHYEDVGTGPAVVFVHGLLVNGRLWRKVTPELSRSARCIAPDLPLGSHRAAMKPDADLSVEGVAKLVADLLEALDLRDVTVVGNDSGGCDLPSHRHAVPRPASVAWCWTTCDAYEVFPPALFSYLSRCHAHPGVLDVAGTEHGAGGGVQAPATGVRPACEIGCSR